MQQKESFELKNTILDAKGLLCPFPVMKVQSKLKNWEPGEILELICTDKGSVVDIPVFCKLQGLLILETLQTEKEIRFKIALAP